MATSKVSLKLLVDKKNQKVLFAEAGKEFVDFLCYLLTMPVGTVTRLLAENDLVGSLGTLYKSIENLNETYLLSVQAKDSVLKPKTFASPIEVPLLLCGEEESRSHKFYSCSRECKTVTDVPKSFVCPRCKNVMSTEVVFVKPANVNATNSNGGGFVKGVVTYMIMDNLEVLPMLAISSITLINKFNVEDLRTLEEKVIDFGMIEDLKLIKASLESKTVLTSVLLGNKRVA